MDCQGKLWSLQRIYIDGTKIFFPGGAKKSNFIPIQGWITDMKIGITEGFATAATLAMLYPDMCFIAALDAYNLEHVALAVRKFNPKALITIYGDDDRQTLGNPGATLARRAAISSNAGLSLPTWPLDAPHTLTDFNDLANWIHGTRRRGDVHE